MSNRQIQPVRPRDYQLARQVRPRSLWGQILTITLQPGYFFLTMPSAGDSRQWFWVAVLILGLVGFSAVRQESIKQPVTSPITAPPIDFGSPTTDLGAGGPGGFPGILGDGGADVPVPSVNTPASTGEVSSTLTTALIAASQILLGWFILAILLCEVSLFNGNRPVFSHNLQIAIWTTVPLGLMAGLQVIYYSAGGGVGQAGLSGLLSNWKAYAELPSFLKSIILVFAFNLTVFWLWSLVLIYRGGRNALNGKRWSVMLVVIVWVLILTVTPVITGTITAEDNPTPTNEADNGGNPPSLDNFGLLDPNALVDSVPSDATLPPELQFLAEPSPEVTAEQIGEAPVSTPGK